MKECIKQRAGFERDFGEQGYAMTDIGACPGCEMGVCQLLEIIRAIEAMAHRIPDHELQDFLHEAILASGFADGGRSVESYAESILSNAF